MTNRSSAPDLALGLMAISVVGLLVVPLPTAVLDVLLLTQLGLGVVLLTTALLSRRPQALSAFPSILLLTTWLRLALNVSTTRLILAHAEAGRVVAAFGEAVVSGSLMAGLLVFLVITLVQYLVVARGAERVAQVAARFALDSLPGRQLSLDAELRGAPPAAARRQHTKLTQELGFFGALDGAMRFIRGDAVAGLVIVGLNAVGGLVVGVQEHGLSLSDALSIYTTLTIGDGLCAQLPSLLSATAAAVLAVRAATQESQGLGRAVFSQLRDPVAFGLAAALFAVLAVAPGFPTLPCLMVAGLTGSAALGLAFVQRAQASAPLSPLSLALHEQAERALKTSPEVLTARLRARLESEYGVAAGLIQIKRQAPLRPGGFKVEVFGVGVLDGVLLAEHSLLCPPQAGAPAVAHPQHGAPSAWSLGRTGLDPDTCLKLALLTGWLNQGEGLLSLQAVATQVETLATEAPALVGAVVPDRLSLPRLATLLRRLLAENLPVEPLAPIFEVLAHLDAPLLEHDERLLQALRARLRGLITQRACPTGELSAVWVGAELEQALRLDQETPSLLEEAREAWLLHVEAHPDAALLAAGDVRAKARRLLVHAYPLVPVLAPEELLPSTRVLVLGVI